MSENTFFLRFADVRSEWIFVPLENAEDQARLLSMQLTGAWLSECIEMDFGVLAPITGRIGRYPSANRGAPSWHGIIADTNMPVEMSPWHKFMTEPPPGWQIFIQPSGMSPEAENLNHLLQTEATRKLPIDHPERVAQGRGDVTGKGSQPEGRRGPSAAFRPARCRRTQARGGRQGGGAERHGKRNRPDRSGDREGRREGHGADRRPVWIDGAQSLLIG